MTDPEQKAAELAERSRKRRRRSNSPKRTCAFSEENLGRIIQETKSMRSRAKHSKSDGQTPRFDVIVAVGLFVATIVFIRALPAY